MSFDTTLTKDEIARYSRQIRLSEIGKEGQLKIKSSSVLVIGAGALGCPVLQYLTAAGVGTIGIVDNDIIDESNLQRQILYDISDISKPKPIAAREKLERLNPNVTFRTHFIRLNKETVLNIIKDYEIIVDCTDNFASRYLINDACVILDKPWVYGAIFKFTGQVMVLNYRNGPTLRCIFPDPPHPLEVPSCAEAGVIGSIAGIIGSIQATEVIKMIIDSGEVLSGKMFILDSLNYSSQLISFKRDPGNSLIYSLGEYEEVCLSDFEQINEISVGELRKMLSVQPNLKIIDLRDEADANSLGLECIKIPYYEISQNLHLFTGNEPVVFYCKYGIKSMNVINYLKKYHNMENLYSLVI
jgi:molybdopterin/thiamine biosynthesis adenylyltransferase/rhodanese-related sulfurtransferase